MVSRRHGGVQGEYNGFQEVTVESKRHCEGSLGIWEFLRDYGIRGTRCQGQHAVGTPGSTTHRSSSISSFSACASWARLVSAWFRCCSSDTSRSSSAQCRRSSSRPVSSLGGGRRERDT